MLADGNRIPILVASTKLEKGLRAMTMKEKLLVHRKIEAENESKLNLWKRFEHAKKCLGFYPDSVTELWMFEQNGYDESVLSFR